MPQTSTPRPFASRRAQDDIEEVMPKNSQTLWVTTALRLRGEAAVDVQDLTGDEIGSR